MDNNNQMKLLYKQFLSYHKGFITIEQLLQWAKQTIIQQWQDDFSILYLDLEFDKLLFENAETEMSYRMLNLKVSREINSFTAIASTAFSASKVAASKLKNEELGLLLMVESVSAYIQSLNENAAAMGFRNISHFYKIVTNKNQETLTTAYLDLLSSFHLMPKMKFSQQKVFECSHCILNCAYALLNFKYNKEIIDSTVKMFEEHILPYLPNEYNGVLYLRLGEINQ